MRWSEYGCFLIQRPGKLTSLSLGAGYDQVDVSACSKRNVRVSNTPNAVNNSTADTAMFLILGSLRRLNVPMTTLRAGDWRGHPPPPLGHDPEGKVLGILGLGGIGRNLKRKAEAFDMRIIYHSRNQLNEELAGTAEYVTFDDLLTHSDVISVNIPLNVGDSTDSLSCLEWMFAVLRSNQGGCDGADV